MILFRHPVAPGPNGIDPCHRLGQYRRRLTTYPPNTMALLRVLLGFASAPDHELEETTGHVLTSLYGNPVYPPPPVT